MESHRWSCSKWPTKPINESPPRNKRRWTPGFEHTDRSMTANESIPTEAALSIRLPPPLAIRIGYFGALVSPTISPSFSVHYQAFSENLQLGVAAWSWVARWCPKGPMAAPPQGSWLTLRFPSMEEAHRWSSSEWPPEPIKESSPRNREDGPPGFEHTDRSMTANEFFPAKAALPNHVATTTCPQN